MTKKHDLPDPLPGDWLPESAVPPRDDEAYWEERMERIMAQAGPLLEEHRRAASAPSWLDALLLRWRSAAAVSFALAASLVLVVTWGPAAGPTPDASSSVLGALAGGGDPAALWTGAGVEADPTLALLVLQGGPDIPARTPGGGDR